MRKPALWQYLLNCITLFAKVHTKILILLLDLTISYVPKGEISRRDHMTPSLISISEFIIIHSLLIKDKTSEFIIYDYALNSEKVMAAELTQA
jgi:hypothetical protein